MKKKLLFGTTLSVLSLIMQFNAQAMDPNGTFDISSCLAIMQPKCDTEKRYYEPFSYGQKIDHRQLSMAGKLLGQYQTIATVAYGYISGIDENATKEFLALFKNKLSSSINDDSDFPYPNALFQEVKEEYLEENNKLIDKKNMFNLELYANIAKVEKYEDRRGSKYFFNGDNNRKLKNRLCCPQHLVSEFQKAMKFVDHEDQLTEISTILDTSDRATTKKFASMILMLDDKKIASLVSQLPEDKNRPPIFYKDEGIELFHFTAGILGLAALAVGEVWLLASNLKCQY